MAQEQSYVHLMIYVRDAQEDKGDETLLMALRGYTNHTIDVMNEIKFFEKLLRRDAIKVDFWSI